jgi:hypothetical protein
MSYDNDKAYQIGGPYREGNQPYNVPMPSQPPQVQMEVNVLGENTDMLAKMVEQLAHQLGPILRPPSPEIERANEPVFKNGEPLAPHAEFLRIKNNDLRRISDRIQDILKRLEV